MKKLVFLFVAVLFTAISANVFAQNTGITPSPGSTFTYNVTDNDNTYLWWVTKGDLDAATTDATIATSGEATTTINWATVIVGDIYYVHLLETDPKTCSNQKVLKVTITDSQFYLAITADKTSPACYDGAVVVTLNAGDPRYNHGTATVSYTVTPSGLGSATGYSFDLADVLSQTTNFASVASIAAGNATIAAGVVTVSDTNPVVIEYEITNSNLYDNSTDAAGTSANFKQTVNITNGVTSLGVTANTTTPSDYTDETDVARPATTSIGFN